MPILQLAASILEESLDHVVVKSSADGLVTQCVLSSHWFTFCEFATRWPCDLVHLEQFLVHAVVKSSSGGPEDTVAHEGHSQVKMAEGSFLASSCIGKYCER